ncbi:MAG TPA: nitrous oxide reductase accessory protein NosL [Nitrospirota bacterium]|nr:nitrous oxide reductase accessory protein NosL [Nitrospirota bacterium]
MYKIMKIFLPLFLLVAIFSFPVFAESISCTECGMMVDLNSKFVAKTVQGDTTRYFCDIGDLFAYLNRNALKEAALSVKDYTTGEWIDARKAFYVLAANKFKTPMGWGFAAFKDKESASSSGSPMDFDSAVKQAK